MDEFFRWKPEDSIGHMLEWTLVNLSELNQLIFSHIKNSLLAIEENDFDFVENVLEAIVIRQQNARTAVNAITPNQTAHGGLAKISKQR